MSEWILVTGGAARIGRAFSKALAKAGYGVAIHYNTSKSEAEALAEEISRAGGRAHAFQAALDDDESLSALVPSVIAHTGGLAALINNASLFEDDRMRALTPERFSAHLAINLKAPIFLAEAFAKALPSGSTGNIINILDQRVLKPNPQFFSYTVSKCALWAATKTMAQALAPAIRVNAIGPGPVLKSVHQTEAEFAHEWETMPLKHGVTPAELCEAVLFLLKTPAVTGQLLTLDGGQHLMWQTPDVAL